MNHNATRTGDTKMTTNTAAFETAAKLTVVKCFNLHHEDSCECACCGREFETAGAILSDGRVVGIACATKIVRNVAIESCGYLPTVALVLRQGGTVPRQAFDAQRGALVPMSWEHDGTREWLLLDGSRIASRPIIGRGAGGRWFQSEEEERAELEARERAAAAYFAAEEAKRAERDAKRAAGTHVGTVGERSEFAAVVEWQGAPNHYEPHRILTVLAVTDSSGNKGQAVCWGAFPRSEKGRALKLTATVKSHGEYRGGPSTTLLRCKVG